MVTRPDEPTQSALDYFDAGNDQIDVASLDQGNSNLNLLGIMFDNGGPGAANGNQWHGAMARLNVLHPAPQGGEGAQGPQEPLRGPGPGDPPRIPGNDNAVPGPINPNGDGAPPGLRQQQQFLGPPGQGGVDAPRGERPNDGPPRMEPLRAGRDFEPQEPLNRNVTGDEYLNARMQQVPVAVRDRINGAIEGLRSPDQAVRDRSLEILRGYGPTAVPFLIRQLDSNDWRTREGATRALEMMGDAAVPGLYSYLDGQPASLEATRRAEQLINRLAPQVRDGAYDDQGRLRLYTNKHGETLFSARYNPEGQLTRMNWNYGGANEEFTRNANGTYTRDGQTQPISNLRVSRDGNITFAVGNRNLSWASNGDINVSTNTNEPLITTRVGSNVNVHGTFDGQPMTISGTPRLRPREEDFWRR